MAATEHVENAIRELEAEQATIAQALAELRGTLAKMRNGAAPPSQEEMPRKGAPGVFQRKYEQNARELIVSLLRENKRPLHVGQIQNLLKGRGFEFIKATIALNLKELHKAEKVRRVKAPSGSGFTHAWLLEKEHSEPEEPPRP